MAKIRFFTATITKDKNALVPVYVRVQSGKAIDIVCKSDLITKRTSWSNENQKTKDNRELNEKLSALRITIENAIMSVHQSDLVEMLGTRNPDRQRSRDRNKVLISWLQTVIDRHWHPEKYQVTLFSFIQDFMEKSKSKPNLKTGRPVGYQMLSDYSKTFEDLKAFAAQKGRPIDFRNINLEFFDEFVDYLQKKKLALNTVKKKITILKVFLNAAKEDGKNPYEGYKSKSFRLKGEDSESIYLDEDELSQIYELDLSKEPELDQVRDLFLVASWTGCRFSDIGQITPENISNGMIYVKQHKTGQKVVIPCNPVVTAILDKYSGILPKSATNQKFNDNIRIVAEMAEINKKTSKTITKGGKPDTKIYQKYKLVTAHAARRSFATNLSKAGFPSIDLMRITGHKTETSFLKYIKTTSEDSAKKLQVHWKLSNLKVI